jgi:aspartyl-tRNA(Asn)/glutamyl-tRNA(Gln) amidotransferase subunit A
MGRDQSAIDYALARKTQLDSKRQMERFFHHYDVLILPSTPVPAPFLDGTDAIKQSRSLTRFTAPFNLTGLPAISIPAGFNSEGLPVGLQIVTQAWAEKKLLRVAHAFEQATEWHKSKPTC